MAPEQAGNGAVKCGAPPSYLWLKEHVDRYAALVGLFVLGPLLVILAALVRRGGGPAIFRQIRAGRHGCPFTLLKFRTMQAGVDPYGDSPHGGDDPRLTRVGRWLRETSLDELPQVLNVLRGEMALVGPRPLYVQQMAEWTTRQRGRLLVKPGLTGLAQIHGRGRLMIEEKLDLDVQYVQEVSLRTDLAILWQTLAGLWRHGEVYEVQYSHARVRRGG
jgi:lipopolysaccharide/colanic/teichoic acid biosynthesis glycosyltransferase